MITESYARSTGIRKITPAMVAARTTAEALPLQAVEMSDLYRYLRQGRSILGLTCQQTELLCYLIAFTQPADWSGEDDVLPVSTASNLDIQQRFDLGRTRVKTLLRELAEAGWLLYRDSPNGQRYRRSGPFAPRGQQAYGFDLSPLARRFDDLERAAQTALWRQQEGRRLHREVTMIARTIYALFQTADEAGLTVKDRQQILARTSALVGQRGTDRDPQWLDPICQELRQIHDQLERDISYLQEVEHQPEETKASSLLTVESDPMGSPERPQYTNTNPSTLAKATVRADGFAENCIEATRSRPSSSSRVAEHQASPPSAADPLRGFRAKPTFVLHIAPIFRQYCSSDRPAETQIIQAALYACEQLGISRHAWAQGQAVFGDYPNAVVIAAIAARTDAGEVRSPGGLLRAMISRYLSGQLALDRTLYGLAEKLKNGPTVVQ
ncbi:plasmid replication protein RepC [Acetobacter ascendens]|uniref:plasmid replication protein RepC n=1 Tax=Acetobacter ascendens TaxID=481146 RepID=UPI000875C0D1|nr:plasmid replication protein RepC [Acetobacter ascendens]AOW50665.1 replication protein C [Acetobacter ascendens]